MRLALDLAPLDAAAILADAAGTQRASVRHAISQENLNREGTPAAWRSLIDAAREVLAQTGTGPADVSSALISFPARFEGGVVRRAYDTDGWNGFAPAAALVQAFALAPAVVTAAPRVLCAAAGEAAFGALQGSESWLYLRLDDDFDAAISANGVSRALDLGDICLDRDGLVGPAGRRGELQAYCGGAALETRAAGYGLTHRGAAEIWELASSNAAAQSLCEDYARRLAQGISIARACFDFSVVCLGGHLALGAGARLHPLLERSLGEFCEPPKIVIATLGRDAAVFGALALSSGNATT